MCTAVSYKGQSHWFGRNLDLEGSFGEQVVITPRNFPLRFRALPPMERHHAMIGMAHISENVPLYYEATNEHGLSMAGLNFPGYARYGTDGGGPDEVAPFELIWWVLGQCAHIGEAKALLERVTLTDTPFSEKLPLTPLHWLVADKKGALAVEPLAEGLGVWDDPVGVLTNSPPFPGQMWNLSGHMGLSSEPIQNRLCPSLDLEAYSRGMGAMGLPGDLSSSSRFVKAAFTKLNSLAEEGEELSQFFHILGAVEQQRGCVRLEGGHNEYTLYSSCCDTGRGIYYYKTYGNSRPTGVDMHKADLEGGELTAFPLRQEMDVLWE